MFFRKRRLRPLIYQAEIARGLPLPRYGHLGDVCRDICAAEGALIPPHSGKDVRTGIHVRPPDDYYFRVVGRGLFAREGIDFPLEIIDRRYTGEIILHPWNSSPREVEVKRGDRIAQLELLPVTEYDWKLVENIEQLGESERGRGRMGSTGRGM